MNDLLKELAVETRDLAGLRTKAPGRLLLALGCLFFAYRLLSPELWTFICDEAVFLDYARAQLRLHQWTTHSPLMGTQGVHYGPAIIWFYGAVTALLGASVEVHTLVMLALFTASNAAVALAVGRLYGDRYLIPATLAALVASSPYQFFWSRQAWDPLANVCTGAIVALLCCGEELSALRAVAIGALIGIAISTHPAVVPLSVVAVSMTFLRSPVQHRWSRVALTVATALVINLPYLHYLGTTSGGSASGSRSFSWPLLATFLSEPLRVSTIAKIRYFFDADWQALETLSPLLANASGIVERVLPWLTGAAALGLVVTLYLARRPAQRMVAGAALVVWAGYAAFYTHLGLEPHPHYQYSTWWIVLVPLAGVLDLLRRHSKVLFAIGVSAIWVIAILQSCFIVGWMAFAQERGGTRGIHFGTPLGQQERLVQSLCRSTRSTSYVVNKTAIFSESLNYLISIEPRCVGKRVELGTPAPSSSLAQSFTLQYEGADTARVIVREDHE